jgi:hypothetical protein
MSWQNIKYDDKEIEALAIKFIQKHMNKYVLRKKWIKIIDAVWGSMPKKYDGAYFDPQKLEFKYIYFALYPRIIKPFYPKDSSTFDSQDEYLEYCHQATWETSHIDVIMQEKQRIIAPTYQIKGKMVKNLCKKYQYKVQRIKRC